MSTQGALQRGRSCPTGRRLEVRALTCGECDVSGPALLFVYLKRESRPYRGKINGGELSAIRLDPPSRSSLAQASHVRRLEFIQSRGTSGRRTTQGHADPLHGLVAASRLGLDHVVTGRRLRQLKEPINAGDRVQMHRCWGRLAFPSTNLASQRKLAQMSGCLCSIHWRKAVEDPTYKPPQRLTTASFSHPRQAEVMNMPTVVM